MLRDVFLCFPAQFYIFGFGQDFVILILVICVSRAKTFVLFCVILVRIRRLRKSPQYLLVILQGKMAVSTNLRKTLIIIAQNNITSLAREMRYLNSGAWKCAIVGAPWQGSVLPCSAWGGLLVKHVV